MSMNSEKGQALILVMVVIALGSLVIPPFLMHADTSIIASRNYESSLYSQYACDSGAEHAIWRLTDGGLASTIDSPGDTITYTLPQTVNNFTTNVTVCNSYQLIASDNFNTGTWTGGTGWLSGWTHSGASAVINTESPYEGAYHLKLESSDGAVKRSVNLKHEINIYLDFWAKVYSFEPTEYATCDVSSDGTNWKTVHTWTIADDDNMYHHFQISLAPYEMTSQFWISFNSHMGQTSDNFYVDKLQVFWLANMPMLTATENFESGNGMGGTGWVGNWELSPSDASITTAEGPHQGSYHLRLIDGSGVAKRRIDLSDAFMVTLQFWAKVYAWEGNDKATLQVSSDNLTWTTVYTWTRALDDNTYHLYTVELSNFDFNDQFWISFNSNMNQTDDYFYVDDINVTKINGYGITVKAGDSVLKAVARIDDEGNITIVSWYYT